jgi:hypothetical protein
LALKVQLVQLQQFKVLLEQLVLKELKVLKV